MKLAIAISIKKMSMCFWSVPVPFFSDMFFSFFYFRAVSEQRMKPYIKLRTTMTSWMWTLVSFKRKLKCNATLYECVLAHFLLYYFYIVFSFPFSFRFLRTFSFSKGKSISDFRTLQSVPCRLPLNVKLIWTNEMYMTKRSAQSSKNKTYIKIYL